MTRTEYLTISSAAETKEERERAHRAYYAQYVTEGARGLIKRQSKKFLGELFASKDRSLNDVATLAEWDRLTAFMPISASRFKENGDYITLNGLLCTLKEAARQVIDDHREMNRGEE